MKRCTTTRINIGIYAVSEKVLLDLLENRSSKHFLSGQLIGYYKVKYKLNGDREKDKERDLNASPFVYGLSSYVSFGNVALYAKYDLSPLFKDQSIDQNNISLGLRFDLD